MENIIGIICEYNPFHNGHLYHLNMIKNLYPSSTIILVTPGYFMQRGDLSILSKEAKVKLSLAMGIDLIIELPFVFATQSADIFAKGAIQILEKLNVQKIVFGSECNDINLLKKLATIQNNKEYQLKVKQYLDNGINYPTAMSKALKDYCSYEITYPNDLLALSYIKAINDLNSNIEPISIKRTNDYHSTTINNDIVSATAIRELLKKGKDISKYVPKELLKYEILNIDNNKLFNLLKYQIITKSKNLKYIQTVDEGLENRIIKVINECNNLEELIEKIKTKRYTYNKIKRMFIHIICNFTKEEANNFKNIEYIRILGLNNNGKKYLNSLKKDINIPIISKLSSSNNEMLILEQRITNIYSIITNNNDLIKKEYQVFPIVEN